MKELNGTCLKQDEAAFNHRKVVNIYIVYKKCRNYNIDSYLTLGNCFLVVVGLTKHTDIPDMELDLTDMEIFWYGSSKNKIAFAVDKISSKIDHRKKDILILGKGPTQELEHTLNVAKIYSINFT